MSDSPLSDAERIRNRRLAKLGSQSQSNGEVKKAPSQPDGTISEAYKPEIITTEASTSNVTHPKATSEETSRPQINISKTDDNPFTQLGLKPPEADLQPAITPMKRDSSNTPRPRSQQGHHETIEEWENRTISHFFRITLDSAQTQDSHGHQLYFLAGVRAGLVEDEAPLRLTTGLLDQALLEAGSDQGKVKPLEYLLACWKRIVRFQRNMKGGSTSDPKYNIVKETRRYCMSYAIIAATEPEVFGQDSTLPNPLAQHLLVDPEHDHGICHDFLAEATSRFDEDEIVKNAFVQALEQLSQDLSKLSMNDSYRPYVVALMNCVRYPPLVTAISQSFNFIPPDLAAQDIEKKTFLGPFFRLSPMQGDVALNYFSSPRTRDRGYIINSQNALRMTLQTHQTELFDITDRFIKASKESRERTLDWFALTVNANHKRRALRTEERYISSDGFMVNVTICLDRLCEPFMDTTFSKINRVEVEYFRRSPRVQIQDETKINADQNESDRFYSKKSDGVSNFISEVFFLTVAAHHYGTEAANTKLDSLRKDLRYMDKQIEKFEEERKKYLSNPAALAHFDRMMKKYKDDSDRGHCVAHAIEGVLLDELAQARSMLFMRYVIVWLIRLVSGVDFPKDSFDLPLPKDQPEVFRCLPEYFIEDVVDHFKFVTSHMPQVITSTQCDELVMICITFLRSTEYIKNPYLKSGLVTILFYGVHPIRNHAKGILGDNLNALPFALQHLLHALMQFYIECEVTGAHTQFYDKFHIRYEIFQVIKCIWSNTIYRENLATEAKVNLDFFVRFVNLLLNDVTFVLDESFTAFHEISGLSKELRDQGASMDETTRTQKEEALEAAKGKAKSYMSLTNETVAMFKLFTDALADSFTIPEVVQRLADMLGYNLDALVGPKSSNLRVDNPGEYHFEPKSLLSDILDVYLNLGSKATFQLAVARDGRSYKPANFTKAASIMQKYALKSNAQLEEWKTLCDTIQKVKEEEEAAEEDLGEVPDEFLDPLLATLMSDPVILPLSRTVIDRSTIQQHLLSDPHDPFNRSPLKIEDVIPDVETRAKIEAFKTEMKAKKLEAQNAAAEAEAESSAHLPTAMDTSGC